MTTFLINVPFGDTCVNFDFGFVPRRLSIQGFLDEAPCLSRVVAFPPGIAEIHAVLATPREAVQWALETFGPYQAARHVVGLLAHAEGTVDEIGAHAKACMDFLQQQLEAAEVAEFEPLPIMAA